MSNDTIKEVVIETAPRRTKHRVPQVLNVPDLPLDAPDYETFLNRLDQPNQSESNDHSSLPDPRVP